MIYPITIESIQNFVFLVNNEMGIIWVLSSQKRLEYLYLSMGKDILTDYALIVQ